MLYSKEDFMLFSLIYSDLTLDKFRTPKLSHDILYEIFFLSLKNQKNIFFLEKNYFERLIKDAATLLLRKNPRINVQLKMNKCKSYFLSATGKSNLEVLKKRVKKEIIICNKLGIHYIFFGQDKYPKTLNFLDMPPFVLFYKGVFPSNNELKKSLAIIGTRFPEKKYGKEVAKRVGKLLALNKWWNISGLATGCDEFGHIGILENNGKSGAILGQGLGTKIFPTESKWLSNEILKNKGFILSELPPTTPSASVFYILRNRLQSGLTRGIFLVETNIKGGALHTVKYSLLQNKITMAWNPSDVLELQDSYEVSGNKALLGITNKKIEIHIKKDLKERIKGIKRLEEIKVILKSN